MWQSLLIKILQALIFPLIDKLWDKVDAYLKAQENKKKAEAARKKMAAARTREEIDNATDNTLDNI